MKEYTLYADNRRPLKFSGELLGVSTKETPEEIGKRILNASALFHEQLKAGAFDAGETETTLELYRTNSGKVVLLTCRVSAGLARGEHVDSEFINTSSSLKVYDSIEAYSRSLGKVGKPSAKLINNVVENHPEFEEFLVETID